MTDATAYDQAPDASLRRERDVTTDDRASEDGAPEPTAAAHVEGPFAAVFRSADVLLVIVALLPAIALGATQLGYCLGAGGWILTRLIAVIDKRWTEKSADPVRRLAMNLFEAFGRIWLLAGVIVLSAVIGERKDGLTAAVVILAAYSVAFVIRLSSGSRRAKAVK